MYDERDEIYRRVGRQSGTDAYVAAVVAKLDTDTLPWSALRTNTCTECDTELRADGVDYADHVVWRDETGDPVVIVGCEGYWLIDPALVGIVSEHWTPAMPWIDWAEVHYDEDHGTNPVRGCPLCDPDRPEQAVSTATLRDMASQPAVVIDGEWWVVWSAKPTGPEGSWEVMLDPHRGGDDNGISVMVDNPDLRMWVLV